MAFGAGTAGAVALWMAGAVSGEERPGPGEPRLWIADRGEGRLVGLDRDLFVSRCADLTRPVALAAGPDGELWCVVNRGNGPCGPHGLILARTGLEVPLAGRPLGLAAADGRALVLVEGARHAEVRALGTDGASRLVGRVRGGICIAASGDRTLVGTRRGGLILLDRRGGRRARLGSGDVRAVAAGPRSTWWALVGKEGTRLVHLSEDLGVRWVAPTGLEEATLAAAAGADSAWVVGGRKPRALRFGPDGRLERDIGPLPMAGLVAGPVTGDGGLWLLAPGAVLRVDGAGRLHRGQGGFGFLVGAVVVECNSTRGVASAAE
jgi:hypothetical protein